MRSRESLEDRLGEVHFVLFSRRPRHQGTISGYRLGVLPIIGPEFEHARPEYRPSASIRLTG